MCLNFNRALSSEDGRGITLKACRKIATIAKMAKEFGLVQSWQSLAISAILAILGVDVEREAVEKSPERLTGVRGIL
jgi:hypothetical protein